MSLITFDTEGRVSSHIDYWDSADAFYTRIPLLGSVIRSIRQPISAGSG